MSSLIPTALKPLVTFAHPIIMTLALLFSGYVGYLGWQVRRTRSAPPELRKELVKGKFNLRHFQAGSILLVILVVGSVGGMAVTYINNGKLFVGAHLLAGLGLACLAVISAALSPLMQQGKEWARISHISINTFLVGIFLWQTVSGFEIVQRILAQMAKAS
jgi:MFS family permease